MARTSKREWLAAGLTILGQTGVDGLTIQSMTERVGLTKGSFYHHFGNMDRFKEALIGAWADQYLTTADDLPETAAERLALLDTIMREAFSRVTEPEIAIRAWAHGDPEVQAVVSQVDAARRRFVLNVFRSVAPSEEAAGTMADIFSTMLIGCITSLPPVPRKRVLALYWEFKRLYGLA